VEGHLRRAENDFSRFAYDIANRSADTRRARIDKTRFGEGLQGAAGDVPQKAADGADALLECSSNLRKEPHRYLSSKSSEFVDPGGLEATAG
jgi:hypothetical protein